jgi:hypothetical protein
MITLNDYQLALIMDLATPLPREQRGAFVEAVAARLKGGKSETDCWIRRGRKCLFIGLTCTFCRFEPDRRRSVW